MLTVKSLQRIGPAALVLTAAVLLGDTALGQDNTTQQESFDREEQAAEREALDPQTEQERRAAATAIKPFPRVNPKFKVAKVYEYLNDPVTNPAPNNRALGFENRYWSYGAILGRDIINTWGQYFVITWVNGDLRGDFRSVFEYRQQNTDAEVKTLELEHKDVKGAVRATFAVLGKAYEIDGPVVSWRFSVYRGDELVARDTSFIW